MTRRPLFMALVLLGAVTLLGVERTRGFLYAQGSVPPAQSALSPDAAAALLAEVSGLRADVAEAARNSMRLQLILGRLQVEALRSTTSNQGRIAERQRLERDLTTQLDELERALSQR